MAKAAILVIEDDADIRELLSYALGKEGWNIVAVADGERGLSLLSAARFDCVVLDIMLPGMDGLEILKRVKTQPGGSLMPVIMATAKGEDSDVVAGLELGADDYIVKPFSPKVLIARIRTALRRAADVGAAVAVGGRLTRGELTLDSVRHEAFFGDRKIDLTATEFAILEFFVKAPGWVFSRNQIITAIKGADYPVTDRSVDVQILCIRKKLAEGGRLIETVRGVGYRLMDL